MKLWKDFFCIYELNSTYRKFNLKIFLFIFKSLCVCQILHSIFWLTKVWYWLLLSLMLYLTDPFPEQIGLYLSRPQKRVWILNCLLRPKLIQMANWVRQKFTAWLEGESRGCQPQLTAYFWLSVESKQNCLFFKWLDFTVYSSFYILMVHYMQSEYDWIWL